MIPFEWFERARERIAPHVVRTPLTFDPEKGIFLKWENHQVTGSFKARGALNKVLSMADWERSTGLVAASAGNHGQGVALAGSLTGAAVEVFVPGHAVASKVDAMRHLGAQVHFVAGGYAAAESAARDYARQENKQYISPYNDGQVIAGQGTIALEVLAQLAALGGAPRVPDGTTIPQIKTWIVPTGGGGLIAASGAVLGRLEVPPALIGVQPEASAFTYNLYHHHTQDGVEDRPTLADGLSGAIDGDSVTIPMMRQYVEDMLVVSEAAIRRAVAFAWHAYGEKIEGSAAVALAAVLEGLIKQYPCLIVLTGGNIQQNVFEEIVGRYEIAA